MARNSVPSKLKTEVLSSSGKKWFLLLLGLLLIGFVVGEAGAEIESLGEGFGSGNDAEADAANLQGVIDDYGPIGDDGKFDYGKYKPFVTKAEVRVAAINLWLDENVGWMRYIFHMKPAISLLFLINVYVILWFFVVLFLNAEGLWFFIEKKGGQRIFGGSVFLIFMVVRLYYGLASVINVWWLYFWNIFVEASIWIGIIGFVIFCLLAIFSFPLITAALAAFAQYQASKKAARDKVEMATKIEAVDALVGQIGK